MPEPFRLGLTRDLLDRHGDPSFGRGPLSVVESGPDLVWELLSEPVDEITPDHAARYDALYLNTPRVTASSVSRGDCRLRLVARHGAGFDWIDVEALARAGVLVTNTPDAVRRPVALMVLTFMLALAHKLLLKDRLTREGRWKERIDHMGVGLTGRVIGIIGAGGIGRETMKLARALDMRVIAARSPRNIGRIPREEAELVPMDQLLAESDFVTLTCLLNDETRHLINGERLARMKRSAFLINVARGGVVNESALIAALRDGTIAGAGLDVFEQEPIDPRNPLLSMDNVVLAPHALGWTEETFANIARTALMGALDVKNRRLPPHIVNPDAIAHPRVQAWFGTSAPAALSGVR